MKCKEAYVCLLASPTPADPPEELRQHLLRCPKCQLRQRRLLVLEEDFRLQPVLQPSAAVQARILDLLEPRDPASLPPIIAPVVRAGRHSWRRWVVGALVTAASVAFAVGLGLGWSLWRQGQDGHLAHVRPATKAGTNTIMSTGPGEVVVGRVLENDLRLAETAKTAEKLRLLADTANELRTEALRLAREGSAEDVLLVSGLYERLIYQGLVPRARSLPVEQQAELTPSIARQLHHAADEVDGAATAVSAGAGEGLRILAAVSRLASGSLTAESPAPPEVRSPAWHPARSGTLRDLLGVLVLQGLRLAEEDDPLRRADTCNVVAEHLVQGILLASSGGDSGRAERLGGFLGCVMERGVAMNLVRFKPEGPDDTRLTEAERVGERSVKAVEELEKNLENAPAAAQVGLERALEAAGNRPPQSPPGKGRRHRGVPPGLHNALEQGRPMPPGMRKGKDAP